MELRAESGRDVDGGGDAGAAGEGRGHAGGPKSGCGPRCTLGRPRKPPHWWQCVLAKNISSDLEGAMSCSWDSG